MDDPAPGASRLRPFETQPFNERSVLDALRKKSCDADARAALESQLAQGGVGSVTAVSAETLLRRFGVTGSAARSIVVSMWEQALKKLLFDDIKVDAAESAYLNELKTALGLRDEEVAGVRSAVLEPEFLRRAEFLLREDPTSKSTRLEIARVARNLRISAPDERKLLQIPARKVLAAILQRAFLLRRIGNEEATEIAQFLDDYDVKFEGDEQNKFVRCWHLSLLDAGTLPDQKIDIALDAGEQCGFGAFAELYEIRKVRRGGFSLDELQRIDAGALYITNRRILFIGAKSSKTIAFGGVANVSEFQQYMVLQRISGKNHQFVFNNEVDREAAIKLIQLMRTRPETGSKKQSTGVETPASDVAQPAAVEEQLLPGRPHGNEVNSVEEFLAELDALTGLAPVKREVRSLVNYLRVQRLRVEQGLPAGQLTVHLVFTGNPGTGKTTVARLLAQIYKAMGFLPEGHLVETDRSGLVGGYLGQTALKTSDVIRKALGGVLFIDEAYSLARNVNGQEGDMYGTEAIDTVLKAMEDNRDQLVVIVAGYREPMQRFLESNPGLRSRFTRYVDFPDYSPAELSEIFDKMVAKAGYKLCEASRTRASALFTEAFGSRTTTFGNGRLVRTLFEQACVRLADRLASDDDITRADLTTFQPRDIDPPSTGAAATDCDE